MFLSEHLNIRIKLFLSPKIRCTAALQQVKPSVRPHGQNISASAVRSKSLNYRSSYRNALRLAATEINMAYRMSDYTRRQQLDFVMGIRIHLSKSHPKPDICDHLAGDYPKDFVFSGWHPWCLCFTTSILMSSKEYKKMQQSGESPKRFVKTIPNSITQYLKMHANQLRLLKFEPYFIADNRVLQDLLK
jgi:hypothetical protein